MLKNISKLSLAALLLTVGMVDTSKCTYLPMLNGVIKSKKIIAAVAIVGAGLVGAAAGAVGIATVTLGVLTAKKQLKKQQKQWTR